eukprot:m51a1_g11996 hypothetical protein (287) ;mRNA; f:4924-7297
MGRPAAWLLLPLLARLGSCALQTGLLVHWSFDGPNASARLLDSSGNGLPPTLSGVNKQNITWAPGVVGTHAIRFMPSWYKSVAAEDMQGATCPYLVSPNLKHRGIRGMAPLTLSLWMKPDLPVSFSNQESWLAAVSTISDNAYGWDSMAWSVLPGQQLQMSAFGTMYSSPSFRSLAGEWVHVATTYDGTGGGSVMTVYLNGQRVAAVLARVNNGEAAQLFVAYRMGAQLCFSGLVDDVRLYTRAVSADEVYDLWRGACNSSDVVLSLGASFGVDQLCYMGSYDDRL